MRALLIATVIFASSLSAIMPHFVPVSKGEQVAVTVPGHFRIDRSSIRVGGSIIIWIGENRNFTVDFRHKMPAKVHVFKGSSRGEHFPTYSQIVFQDVYNGIHRVLTANERGINISWVVEPGADPSVIKFRIDSEVSIAEKELLADNFKLSGIRAYQGAEVVDVTPVVENGIVSFEIGEYDPSEELIIDPDLTTLNASTYVGATGSDQGEDIIVANNHVYIVGTTDSSSFPVTGGAYDNTFNGEYDIFVAKMNLALDTLYAATFLGGDSYDYGYAIDAQSNGNIVIAGVTYSMNFPIQNGVFSIYSDSGDAYVAIFSSDLDSLIASTYFGGSAREWANDVAVKNDSIYICGATYSTDLPNAGNPYSSGYAGYGDGFIAEFLPDLSDIVVNSYLGGDDEDALNAISIDTVFNTVYVAGYSMSSNMPITSDAYDPTNSGYDAYIANLTADLSGLLGATFLGATSGMELPPTEAKTVRYLYYPEHPDFEAVAVGGYTNAVRFPLIFPFDSVMSGFQEGFISIFTPGLDSLIVSSYVGGVGWETVNDIKRGLSSSPSIVAVGETDSSMMPGATGSEPFDSSFNGAQDAFVYVIVWSSDSITPIGFTYYGGSSYDMGKAVFVKDTLIYITGSSESSNLPMLGGFDASFGGVQDGFVAAFNHEVAPSTGVREKEEETSFARILKNDVIRLEVKKTAYVGITAFDVTGRRVFDRTLGVVPPGIYDVRVNGLKSGVNFLRVRKGDRVEVLRVLKY